MPELLNRHDDKQKMAYLDSLIREVYLKDIEEHDDIRMSHEMSLVCLLDI